MRTTTKPFDVEAYPKATLAIKPSVTVPGHVGVFALRRIPAKTIVAHARDFDEGVLIPWADFKRLDLTTRQRLRMFCWQSEEGVHAPRRLDQLTIQWHFNHSCAPNLFMDEAWNYRTLRAIRKDEELTIDIGSIMTDPKFRLKCCCGLPNCVGIIRSRKPDR